MNTLKIDLETFDVPTDCSPWFNRPEKNIESVAIPGRNGSLIIDHGTFNNFVATFPCYIQDSFNTKFPEIVNRLGAYKGYQDVRCSMDPAHFRRGVAFIPTNPRPVRLNKDGFFDLNIEFMPQRFLLSGTSTQSILDEATSWINNPTNYDARPLLRVWGSGTISVNGQQTITIADAGYTSIYIDSAAQECYDATGVNSCNNVVSFSNYEFPVLKPRNNQILFSGNITRIDVTPNFWEL